MAETHGGSKDALLELLARQAAEIAALRAELAERREQCRAVLQHCPRPTWIYSLDTLRFLDVNDAAIRGYGWTRDEFLTMTIADIRPDEDRPAFLANLARLRGQPGGLTGPWRHHDKRGAVMQAMVTFVSVPFAGHAARLVIAEPDGAPAGAPPELAGLSRRERQVFGLVARGHTSQAIAEKLGLSPKSVETYRARFMAKLRLRNRTELVEYAIAHRILGA